MFELQDTTLRSTIAAERAERLAGAMAAGRGGTLRKRLAALLSRADRIEPGPEPECVTPAPIPFRG